MSFEKKFKEIVSAVASPQIANTLAISVRRILSSSSPMESIESEINQYESIVKSILEKDFSSSIGIGPKSANLISLLTTRTGIGGRIASFLLEKIKRDRLRDGGDNAEPTLIIWLIDTVVEGHIKQELYNTADHVKIFDDRDKCVDYLLSKDTYKTFLIVSCHHIDIISLIWQIPQLLRTYVFCEHREKHICSDEYVNTIYNDENSLMEQLVGDIELHSNVDNILSMRILSENSKENLCRNLNRDEYVSFIWFQLLIEILIRLPNTDNAKSEMVKECVLCYKNNISELSKINSFKHTDCLEKTIDWYTKDSFVYRLLNKALRTENIDIIFKFRYFIQNLHNNLTSLHKDFIQTLSSTKFTVFRGQLLSANEFKMLLDNIGELISINQFLSTTLDRNLALSFAGNGSESPLKESILFQLECDTIKNTKPFASTNTSEREVLFSIGTIFRIRSIEKLEKIWSINLILEDDKRHWAHMQKLPTGIMAKISTNPTVERIAEVLSSMGEYQKAQKYYDMARKAIPLDDINNIARITTCIGDCEKDYNAALRNYTNALELANESINPDRIFFAKLYEKIGIAYFKLSNYKDAFKFQNKSLDIYNEVLSPDEHFLAVTYYNIGRTYHKLGNKQLALVNLDKSMQMLSTSSLSVQTEIAPVYSEMGLVYLSLENYDESLMYLEMALNINKESPYLTKRSLMARNYYDIGTTLYEKGTDDDKAFEAFRNAIDIYRNILPVDREIMAKLHDNIVMINLRRKEWIQSLKTYAQSCEYRFGEKR